MAKSKVANVQAPESSKNVQLFSGPHKSCAAEGTGGGEHVTDPCEFSDEINRWIWEYGIDVIVSRTSAGMRVAKVDEKADSKKLFDSVNSLGLAVSGKITARIAALKRGEWTIGGGGRPVSDPIEVETWTLIGNALRQAGLSTEKLKALSMADNIERIIRSRTPGATDSAAITKRAEEFVATCRAKAVELVASRNALDAIDLSDLT